MSEGIVITSGKGGVGKTTTTAHIGIGLAKLGKKVIVIDTDLGLRNLDVVLGLENRIIYNIVDVINGHCRLKQALIKDTQFPELCLLPSAQKKYDPSSPPQRGSHHPAVPGLGTPHSPHHPNPPGPPRRRPRAL